MANVCDVNVGPTERCRKIGGCIRRISGWFPALGRAVPPPCIYDIARCCRDVYLA
jgi:hypothetical protein